MRDILNLKKKIILQVCVNRCLQRGAGGSGRSDDNPESLNKRFHTYMNDTMPIIQYYKEKNLVKKVDASGTPDEVGNVLCLLNVFQEFWL
jgi:adenylate kinase family enzyme